MPRVPSAGSADATGVEGGCEASEVGDADGLQAGDDGEDMGRRRSASVTEPSDRARRLRWRRYGHSSNPVGLGHEHVSDVPAATQSPSLPSTRVEAHKCGRRRIERRPSSLVVRHAERRRPGCFRVYSGLNPAPSMAFDHFCISACTKSSISFGVDTSASPPMTARRF